MNLRNEMAGEKGNHPSDSAPFTCPAGQVAVAMLLVPASPFMAHVNSHHLNNSAEYRNRTREEGMTYNNNVYKSRSVPGFISEEAGWDRIRGACDDQRNRMRLIML